MSGVAGRAGLAGVTRFRLLDTTFAIDTTRADLADLSSLADLAAGGDPSTGDVVVVLARGDDHWLLTVDNQQRQLRVDADLPVELLTSLNDQALSRTRWFATHAGAVALGGRVVAFPGASGSGKSTLTAACLLRGFGYVSDEALCLEPDGAVVPYLKPLALSAWSRDALGLVDAGEDLGASPGAAPGERLVRAADLGATLAAPPLRVTDIVLRERGALAFTQLPRRAGGAELLRRSFNHFRAPEAAFDLVHAVAATCRVWQLTCTDPLTAAELLAERLSAGD